MVDEAVSGEPVSEARFPANREKNREFIESSREFAASRRELPDHGIDSAAIQVKLRKLFSLQIRRLLGSSQASPSAMKPLPLSAQFEDGQLREPHMKKLSA